MSADMSTGNAGIDRTNPLLDEFMSSALDRLVTAADKLMEQNGKINRDNELLDEAFGITPPPLPTPAPVTSQQPANAPSPIVFGKDLLNQFHSPATDADRQSGTDIQSLSEHVMEAIKAAMANGFEAILTHPDKSQPFRVDSDLRDDSQQPWGVVPMLMDKQERGRIDFRPRADTPTTPDGSAQTTSQPLSPTPQPTVTDIGLLVRETVREELPTVPTVGTPTSEADSPVLLGSTPTPQGTPPTGENTPWRDLGTIIGETIAHSVSQRLDELIRASRPTTPEKPATSEQGSGNGLLQALGGSLGQLFPNVAQLTGRILGADDRMGTRFDSIRRWLDSRGKTTKKDDSEPEVVSRETTPENTATNPTEMVKNGTRKLIDESIDPASSEKTAQSGGNPTPSGTGPASTVARAAGRAMQWLGRSRAGRAAKTAFGTTRGGQAAWKLGRTVATRLAGAGAGTGAGAAGAAGAGAGAGAGASAAGGALAGLAAPVAAVGVAAVAVGVGLKEMNDAVDESTNRLMQHNRQLGQMSLLMGQVMAEAQGREAIRSAQTGDRLAESAKFLMEQDQYRKDNQQEIQILTTRIENTFMGVANTIVGGLLGPLNGIAGAVNDILEAQKNAKREEDAKQKERDRQEFEERAKRDREFWRQQ